MVPGGEGLAAHFSYKPTQKIRALQNSWGVKIRDIIHQFKMLEDAIMAAVNAK
ncbi:hypothetical protein FACS189449_13300 [Alphaproteobacteria bacterium]|nr:hypothetical protein FACS189449_13300 [Alphaproteobacteria bacterium]